MTANRPEALRIPPHSQQAESAVIGAILANGKSDQRVRELFDSLSADMFYGSLARDVYTVAAKLDDCDVVTITDEMERKGYFDNGLSFTDVAEFGRASFLISQLPKYIEVIKTAHSRRNIIAIANNVIDQSYAGESAAEITEYAIGQLSSVDNTIHYTPSYITDLLDDWVNLMEARTKNERSALGIPTGLKELDRQIIGLGDSWLVILAGRPSHGKSLIAQIIGNAISRTAPVLFMSMEMSERELMDRNFGIMASVDPTDIRRGSLSDEQWQRTSAVMSDIKENEYQLYYDETPGLSVEQICARAKAFKKQHPTLGVIQIDYLGLMQTPKADRNDLGIGKITRRLKQLAKEISTPVMLLTQLNREADNRSKPKMNNLADSASIERDADLVMFTHRPEVSNEKCDHFERGLIEITCGKFRHGSAFNDVLIKNIDGEYIQLNKEEIESIVSIRADAKPKRKGMDL